MAQYSSDNEQLLVIDEDYHSDPGPSTSQAPTFVQIPQEVGHLLPNILGQKLENVEEYLKLLDLFYKQYKPSFYIETLTAERIDVEKENAEEELEAPLTVQIDPEDVYSVPTVLDTWEYVNNSRESDCVNENSAPPVETVPPKPRKKSKGKQLKKNQVTKKKAAIISKIYQKISKIAPSTSRQEDEVPKTEAMEYRGLSRSCIEMLDMAVDDQNMRQTLRDAKRFTYEDYVNLQQMEQAERKYMGEYERNLQKNDRAEHVDPVKRSCMEFLNFHSNGNGNPKRRKLDLAQNHTIVRASDEVRANNGLPNLIRIRNLTEAPQNMYMQYENYSVQQRSAPPPTPMSGSVAMQSLAGPSQPQNLTIHHQMITPAPAHLPFQHQSRAPSTITREPPASNHPPVATAYQAAATNQNPEGYANNHDQSYYQQNQQLMSAYENFRKIEQVRAMSNAQMIPEPLRGSFVHRCEHCHGISVVNIPLQTMEQNYTRAVEFVHLRERNMATPHPPHAYYNPYLNEQFLIPQPAQKKKGRPKKEQNNGYYQNNNNYVVDNNVGRAPTQFPQQTNEEYIRALAASYQQNNGYAYYGSNPGAPNGN